MPLLIIIPTIRRCACPGCIGVSPRSPLNCYMNREPTYMMVCISVAHILTKCTYCTFGAAPHFGGNISEALPVDLASTDLHTFVTMCFQLITEHIRKHSLIHVRTITPSYAI
jgi:hypothetical protein